MKKIKNNICLFLLISNSVWANDPDLRVVNTTGGNLKSADVVIDYSIGEIAITTISNNQGFVTQGFLQPSKKTISALAFENHESTSSIFPNPIQDKLYFSTGTKTAKTATIYTIDGEKIITFSLVEEFLDASFLKPGIYYIEFTDTENNVFLKSKIAKV